MFRCCTKKSPITEIKLIPLQLPLHSLLIFLKVILQGNEVGKLQPRMAGGKKGAKPAVAKGPIHAPLWPKMPVPPGAVGRGHLGETGVHKMRHLQRSGIQSAL